MSKYFYLLEDISENKTGQHWTFTKIRNKIKTLHTASGFQIRPAHLSSILSSILDMNASCICLFNSLNTITHPKTSLLMKTKNMQGCFAKWEGHRLKYFPRFFQCVT